jgi:hypothetical protein
LMILSSLPRHQPCCDILFRTFSENSL